MGKKSQSVGAALERWLVEQNEELRRARLADVGRTKPEMNIVGRSSRGKMLCVPSGKPCADFEGVLRGGRAVVFDAKSTKSDRFAFSLVPDEQLAYLTARSLFGARAFFYVRHRLGGRSRADYVVPVSPTARIGGVAHRRSHEILALETRESVRFDALEAGGWRVRPAERWLDAMARQVEAGAWETVCEPQVLEGVAT